MTQEEFGAALRIPTATVRNWEQQRVIPDPAARAFLTILDANPKAMSILDNVWRPKKGKAKAVQRLFNEVTWESGRREASIILASKKCFLLI